MYSKISAAGLLLGLSTTITSAAFLDIDFHPANFPEAPASNTIDNPYWPLIAGTSFVYFAETADGCEVNRMTVTSAIKDDFGTPYDTIAALVVEDLEWESEECDGDYVLMEKTLDWYAQDDDGNIWYLGEFTEAFEDEEDCTSDEGSWQAGDEGAEAGTVILADPAVGVAYRQEYLEGEAEDIAKVLSLNNTVELEGFGPFTDCLKTKEWTPLESGAVEHKFYCPSGGGLMLIQELKGKTVRVEYIGDTLPPGNFPTDFPTSTECLD